MAYGIGTYCASNFNVTANHSDNSVVFAQLAMEHPHILLLGAYVFFRNGQLLKLYYR